MRSCLESVEPRGNDGMGGLILPQVCERMVYLSLSLSGRSSVKLNPSIGSTFKRHIAQRWSQHPQIYYQWLTIFYYSKYGNIVQKNE
jgi:hypothetical protein